MVHIKHTEAPVAFWTPAQQLECARWLRAEHGHSAGYITRLFNIMRSAFIDATQIKLRPVVVGDLVEAATPRAVSARQTFSSAGVCACPLGGKVFKSKDAVVGVGLSVAQGRSTTAKSPRQKLLNLTYCARHA